MCWHLYVASGDLASEFSLSCTNCLTRLPSLVYPGFGITVFLLLGQLPVKATSLAYLDSISDVLNPRLILVLLRLLVYYPLNRVAESHVPI